MITVLQMARLPNIKVHHYLQYIAFFFTALGFNLSP